MKRANVICPYFIGDTLFASAAARPLREELGYDEVYYHSRLRQPLKLLNLNPYITGAFEMVGKVYDNDVFVCPPNDQCVPATIHIQKTFGIKERFQLGYEIYTSPEDNELVSQNRPNKTVVAIPYDFFEKTFGFTEEEYERAIDVPQLGYGGRRRNVDYIISKIDAYILRVGGNGEPQTDWFLNNAQRYSETASLLHGADFFFGPEGGLCNLAAGVGTQCIMDTTFLHQLYGPKGVLKQCENPQLGPKTFFPNEDHVHLNPYLTDDEVIKQVNDIINQKYMRH